jgi:spore coat polysaccharide biosynthesis protein SpsF
VSLGILIQVRLGSTRLVGKALLPLPGGTVIQHVMRAMAEVPADVHALVTEERSAEALAPLAREEGFESFVGPEDDVLARYCLAAREYGVDEVIRATGDNPLTSPVLARDILRLHRESASDLSHFLGIPWGSGVEVVQARSLFAAEVEAVDPAEREHVTMFLYRHPGRFRILQPQAPAGADLPDVRVTVDTPADYERVRRIFEELYRGQPIEIRDLAAWLKAGEARRGEGE